MSNLSQPITMALSLSPFVFVRASKAQSRDSPRGLNCCSARLKVVASRPIEQLSFLSLNWRFAHTANTRSTARFARSLPRCVRSFVRSLARSFVVCLCARSGAPSVNETLTFGWVCLSDQLISGSFADETETGFVIFAFASVLRSASQSRSHSLALQFNSTKRSREGSQSYRYYSIQRRASPNSFA